MREERIREIARHTGLTGVEAQHIVDALYEKGIDPSVIDWEKVISQAREYGNRYEAVWDYLEKTYGISKPWQYRYGRETIKRYELEEIEHNAEQFKGWVKTHPAYHEIMMAICFGRGKVPKDIQNMIGYKGKKFEYFKTLICEDYVGYAVPSESAEKMIEKGVRKLREHFSRMPPQVYLECGEKGGIDTAICLKEASKRAKLSYSWVDEWVKAMQ